MRIREMTDRDLPGVREVARETWPATYAGIIPEDVQKQFVERVYSDDLLSWRGERGVFLVAEDGGVIVGFADFNKPFEDDRVVSLAAIYILPAEQRRGIGSELLREGIRRFPDANKLVVRFERGNLAARRFYERHGFEEVGQFEEDFLGHPSRMVEMSLELDASL
ncbi:MAG: GNAT family N-acetyltransferase [Rubrobacteraceae bacterium]